MNLKGFFDLSDGIEKGKGITAIQNSKDSRSSLISLFGGLENMPSSVMKAKRVPVKESEDELCHERSYDNTAPGMTQARNDKLPKSLREAYKISGRGCQSGALSRFPQNIGRSMVLMYSDPGDTVFDPFAGHNSRMELCVVAGRHYTGCDLSAEFMKFNRKKAKRLRKDYPKLEINLHHVDSRNVPVGDDSCDFTITSPPYYDIEFYGDESEQLGKSKTYKGFLAGLKKVMRENYRVLKSGSFAIWFVNDFRRRGVFHLYHVDTISLAESVGFVPHDLLISDLGRSIRDCFAGQTVESRILPKRHEYGLIFKKP